MASRAGQNANRVFQAFGRTKDGLKTKIADEAARLVGITDLLEESDKEWSALGQHVTQHVACLLAARPSITADGDMLKEPWDKLQTCVKQIESACAARVERNKIANIAFAADDTRQIAVLRRAFDDAFGLFKLNLDLSNFNDVEKYLGSLNIDQLTRSIVSKVKEDLVPRAIEALPYASGAAWDSDKVCLPGTRDEMLDKIWNFIYAVDGATCAQIFWLVDVAGSGKTAIAHSVCKRAKEAGLLVTAFFFDRLSAERNNPDKLITTMARDLATIDKSVAMAMASALERDASLHSASIRRQFDELIAQPSVISLAERQRPHVFVLDALDEGLTPDDKLTAILSSGIRDLPANFRIIVTSRPTADILYAFDDVSHIHKHTINLRGNQNQIDIATYTTHRLAEVASKRRRKLPWPESSVALQLIQKSEGHFLWVSAVTEFLGRATNPDRQLEALLSLGGIHNTEAKMDQLYAAVLQTCPWEEDDDFFYGYKMYMGTMIAAKDPLTANALQQLHDGAVHPRDMFEKLASLITGFDDDNELVRPLHLSLQEYLTLRAPSPYHLDKKDHSQTLAVLCMKILNTELLMGIPAVDAFSLMDAEHTPIPKIATGMISETLHYASRFWSAHVLDLIILSNEAIQCLQPLLATRLVTWIKLCVCLGQYPAFSGVRAWLQTAAQENHALLVHVHALPLAWALTEIAWRLRASGRRKEALSAAQDAVTVVRDRLRAEFGIRPRDRNADSQRQHEDLEALRSSDEGLRPGQHSAAGPSARGSPERNADCKQLARSLSVLSACLSDMGLRQEALKTIEEAVELHRVLVRGHATAFSPDLAVALNNLSIWLGDMGRREEALKAIQEVVQLYRGQDQSQAAVITPLLALSLINFALALKDMGRREEALTASMEAVQHYRRLVLHQATAFTPQLAGALTTHSICLTELNRPEEALQASEEAVQLRRLLVQAHAAAYTPALAKSLTNLSVCLGKMNRREDALKAIEEAVHLRRLLVRDEAPAFTLDLAVSLTNLGNRLAATGQIEAGLKAVEESVQLLRKLLQSQATAFRPTLARTLFNQSILWREVDRHQEALTSAHEANELYRVIAAEYPTVFNRDLQDSLKHLSNCFRALGRKDEAGLAAREAQEVAERLRQADS